MTHIDPTEVVAEREISVPAEQAYNAWADAALLSQWFTTNAKQDFRVGGRYSNDDGDAGEFLEVVPNERLKFTWEQPQHKPGSTVTVEFIPDAPDIVDVRLTHSGLRTEEDAASLQEGWEWALDSLKSFLESGEPIRYNEWASRKEMGM
jgi:uncharacterized protein YndB with AHSA1/START domain